MSAIEQFHPHLCMGIGVSAWAWDLKKCVVINLLSGPWLEHAMLIA